MEEKLFSRTLTLRLNPVTLLPSWVQWEVERYKFKKTELEKLKNPKNYRLGFLWYAYAYFLKIQLCTFLNELIISDLVPVRSDEGAVDEFREC